MMVHNQNSNSSIENMYPPNAQYPTTVVPSNKKDPLFEGGHYTKKWWHVDSQI